MDKCKHSFTIKGMGGEKNMNLLKMNLQTFAEPPVDPIVETPKDDDVPPVETPADDKKYTDAEVNDIVKKKLAKAEADKSKAVQEAEKLAKMNADEKQKYEFEQLQAKLAEFEKKDQYYSLSKEANKMLAEHDIQADDELLQLIVKDTADDTNKAVQSFVTLFNAKVEQGVNKALTGKSPRMNTSGNTGITKTDFDKMGYKEKVELNQKNPDLYNQLTKGD